MIEEKRLEYLFKKRTELQRKIAELKKESSAETVNECMTEKNYSLKIDYTDTITEYRAEWFSINCIPAKTSEIDVRMKDGCFCISASEKLLKHTYVYLSKYWQVFELQDDNKISLVITTENPTSVRPIIVFYDNGRKKIAHNFFLFNVPTQFNVPEGAVYANIGFRLVAEDEVDILKLKFKVPTLRELCELDFVDRIKEKIELIPSSNGSRYYEKCNKKFGLIADQFLFDAYKNVADCIYITPDNYKEYISSLDFLIVASAWHGLNNEWDGMTKVDTYAGKMIYTVIKAAKKNKIPVVFYSKEDPPNYEYFVDIAKKCDYIFTSAYEMIERYKEDCETDKVDSLCFCINPEFHNPIGICSIEPEDGVIFSGSWMTKYPERVRKLESIFDGILASGKKLKIIDRNFDKNDPKYYFPEKYYACISPAIEHDILQKVHKLYAWAVNINSVTDSKTMFANRVYELQAIGNLLISNYSLGVSEKFDGVFISENEDEVASILNSMAEDEIYYKRIQNIRRVMTGETTFDRLGQIMNAIGLDCEVTERKIAVVVKEKTSQLVRCFENQSYLQKVLMDESECAEEKMQGIDVVAFWSPEYEYGKYYLEDMVNAFKYTSCSYITKDSYFVGGEVCEGVEHDYVQRCNSKYASLFWKSDYSVEKLLEFPEEIDMENGYSIDHFELKKRR